MILCWGALGFYNFFVYLRRFNMYQINNDSKNDKIVFEKSESIFRITWLCFLAWVLLVRHEKIFMFQIMDRISYLTSRDVIWRTKCKACCTSCANTTNTSPENRVWTAGLRISVILFCVLFFSFSFCFKFRNKRLWFLFCEILFFICGLHSCLYFFYRYIQFKM